MVSINDIKSVGEFVTTNNFNFQVLGLEDHLSDMLNIKLESISISITASSSDYNFTFLETIDRSTYQTLKKLVRGPHNNKIVINFLDRCDNLIYSETLSFYSYDVELEMFLGAPVYGSEVQKIQLRLKEKQNG